MVEDASDREKERRLLRTTRERKREGALPRREKKIEREDKKEREEGERVKVSAHNRIVTCTSSSCFHNYGLLKIRIGATRQRKAHYRSLGNVRARDDDDESTGKMIPHLRDEA